jgi:hypothetical protein
LSYILYNFSNKNMSGFIVKHSLKRGCLIKLNSKRLYNSFYYINLCPTQ